MNVGNPDALLRAINLAHGPIPHTPEVRQAYDAYQAALRRRSSGQNARTVADVNRASNRLRAAIAAARRGGN